jgi:S-adenosylmethionine hydrolase
MIASEFRPEKIVEINIHDRVESSFPVLDVFVKVACHIKRGGLLDVIGKEISDFKKIKDLQPVISSDATKIAGSVIYIDNYGNIITNISKKLFDAVGKGRDFEMLVGRYSFKKIYEKYSDIVNFSIPVDERHNDGSKLSIFNSAGFIEIAIYRSNLETVGGASNLLGLKYRDQLTITFS